MTGYDTVSSWFIKHSIMNVDHEIKTRACCIALLLFFTTSCLVAQHTNSRDSQQVQRVITDFFEGLSMRDSTRLKMYSTADIALYEHGMVWNLDSLVRNAVVLNTATD